MPWMRTRLLRSTSTLTTRARWGGHERSRAISQPGLPPPARVRGGTPKAFRPRAQRSSCPPHLGELNDAFGGLRSGLSRDDARLLQEPPALFFHRAGHSDDQGFRDVHLVAGGNDPARYLVAARDAAEDIDEHAAHLGVEEHHLQCVADALGVRAS